VSGTEAMELGLVPFIVGDLLKVAVAGLLLPATWALVTRLRQ
jgi:biotin transport system substrate-specific component